MRGILKMREIVLAAALAGSLTAGCAAPDNANRIGATTSQPAQDRARLPLDRVPRFVELLDADTPATRPLAAQPTAAPPSSAPSPAAQLHLREGRSRFKQGLWADAIATLLRALEADPNLPEARVLLGRAYRQLGDSAAARKHFLEARRLQPRDATINRLLGELALESGDAKKAIAYFFAALDAEANAPTQAESILIRLHFGLALRSESYLLAAVDQFAICRQAIDTDGESLGADPELNEAIRNDHGKLVSTIGELEMRLERFDRAVKTFRRAVSDRPDDAELRRHLILALAAAGHAEDAMREMAAILDRPGDTEARLSLLEQVCNRLGRPDRYDLELARLAGKSKDPALRRRIADIMAARGKTAESIAILRQLESEGVLEADGSYRLAEIHRDARAWPEMVASLTQALHEAPDTHRRARAILDQLTDPAIREAVRAAIPSASTAPSSIAEADFLRARLLELDGRLDEALASLRSAIDADPEFPGPHAALARILATRADWDELIAAAKAARQAGVGDPELSLHEGRAFAALDDFEHAQEAFLASFRLDRTSPLPLFELAEEADRRGQVRECEQLYRRILDDVDPRFAPAREKLIRLYLNANQINRAEAYFSDFARLDQTGSVVDRSQALLAFAGATSRRAARAKTPQSRDQEKPEPSGEDPMTAYQQALAAVAEKYPDDPGSRLDLAMTSLALGEFDQALASADDALRLDPGNLRALELKATALQKLLRFADAARIVETLLTHRPRNPPYQQRRIELALADADYDKAVRFLRDLLGREDAADRNMLIAGELVQVLVEAERFDDAVAEAQKRLDQPRSAAIWRSIYLAILRSAGRADQAVDQARRWLESAPGDNVLRLQLVEQLENAQQYIEAQQLVLDWLADQPDDWNLNRELIRLFWFTRNHDSAIETASLGFEADPTSDHYREFLIHSHLLAGHFDQAVDLCRKQAKRADDLAAHVALISALTEAQRFLEAEESANRLLAPHLALQQAGQPFDPDLVMTLHRMLSRIYELTARPSQAIAQLEENLKFSPGAAGANNDLGYLMADSQIDLPRAERMIRLAVAEEPRSYAYLDSLGWVLYKQARFADARMWLQRAARLARPGDPVIHDHLADTLYRLGLRDEAAEAWKKARDLCESRAALETSLEETRLAQRLSAKLSAWQQGKDVPVASIADPARDQPASRPDEPETTKAKQAKPFHNRDDGSEKPG